MIIPITWMQYWRAIAVIAVVYYIVILGLYFRKDIQNIIKGKHFRKKETTNNKLSSEHTV